MINKYTNKQRGLLAVIMAMVMVFAGIAVISEVDADTTPDITLSNVDAKFTNEQVAGIDTTLKFSNENLVQLFYSIIYIQSSVDYHFYLCLIGAFLHITSNKGPLS